MKEDPQKIAAKSEILNKESYKIDDLLNIMHYLRSECPWDAKQTHHSLKQYLLEETYEVLEAIDQEQWEELGSELGDLLLQIVFHSEIASEHGRFNFDDVVQAISKKLINRHPHVFAKGQVRDATEVQNNWEHSKLKNENRPSLLNGVPKFAPALLQSQRLQEKAATVGFDWNALRPVMDKFEEEWGELKTEIENGRQDGIEEEFGDLLFSLVNIGRFLQLNAEDALRRTNEKFIRRFRYVEAKYNNNPDKMKQASLQEMDQFWEEAKKEE